MAQLRVFIVDVFAEEKYAGNQLAVVTGGAALAPAAMQRIARETNFSETTFIASEATRTAFLISPGTCPSTTGVQITPLYPS